ncbi:hypothetical protein AB6D11_00850 [Vibrio splendidus]
MPHITRTLSHNIRKARDALVAELPDPAPNWRLTGDIYGGLLIDLFNHDQRPTRYQVTFHANKHGHVTRIEFDTLCRDIPSHLSVQCEFPIRQLGHAKQQLHDLLSQPSTGDLQNLLDRFYRTGRRVWESDPAFA